MNDDPMLQAEYFKRAAAATKDGPIEERHEAARQIEACSMWYMHGNDARAVLCEYREGRCKVHGGFEVGYV